MTYAGYIHQAEEDLRIYQWSFKKATASASSILLWFCFLLKVTKCIWLSLCFRSVQLLSLSPSLSIPSLSHFDVPWIIEDVLRSLSRKWYIPKQDCYLLCFGRLGCFVYERKNFGIFNACRLPVKSVKSCGRSILVLWQITSFREVGSGKPAHNLSTIILHQICSKGTQLTTEQARSLKMILWRFKTVWESLYYLRKEFDLFMVRVAKKDISYKTVMNTL